MTIELTWSKVAKMAIYGGGIIGTGVLLFKYTVPTDEQLIAAFSPEVRANYEKNRAFRQKEQEELMKIARETASSNDPIWKTGKLASPFEKDTRGAAPKLVDAAKFFQEKEDEKNKVETQQAQADLLETQRLIALSKKSWWSWR